jgi:hypothetical protein
MNKIARFVTTAAVASAFLLTMSANAQETKLEADLSGKSEVPAVDTPAHGQATFELSADGKTLMYTLSVDDIEDVTMAHIHLGKPGELGKPVVPLYPAKMSHMSSEEKPNVPPGGMPMPSDGKMVKMSGEIAHGTITAEQLMGSLKGKTLEDLVTQIRAGKAYVNVHTKEHPDGEIRGAIK